MKTDDPTEEDQLLINPEDNAVDSYKPQELCTLDSFADSKAEAEFKPTLKRIFFSAIPVTLTVFVTFFTQTITMHFLKGQNDIVMTGSYGLAGSVMNMTYLVLFLSLNLGLLNCAAHAYGAGNLNLVGLYYHRALVIHTIICIPCAFAFWWSDELCLLINFDDRIATYIRELLVRCIPGMFAQMVFTTTVAYLNGCGVFTVPGLIPPVGCIMYWIAGYFFIERLGLGMTGAAICYNIQSFWNVISLFVYVKFWDPVPNTFFCFHKGSFTGLLRLLKLELLTGSMVYLEWIAFEIIAVFSGRLAEKPQFTGISIFFAHTMLVGAIAFGAREVILAFVAQALGERNIKKAKMVLKAGMFIMVIETIIIVLYLIFLSRFVLPFYTNDEATQEVTAKYFLLLAVLVPSDHIQSVFGSAVRALRKDREGTMLMIVGYYVVSVPLSYVLGFNANLGGAGLLLGVIGGSYCLLVGLVLLVYSADWEKQMDIIHQETETGKSIDELDKI